VRLSQRSTVFRVAAAAVVVVLALAMLLACHGDVDMLMPVAMVCAVVLTAIAAAPLAALAGTRALRAVPFPVTPARAGPAADRFPRAGPPLRLLTGVLQL
jgi:hypothetical protein